MVDAGDNFTNTFDLPERERWQAEVKADVIAASLQQIGIDAMVPGLQDLTLGRSVFMGLVRQYKLPYVAANLRSVHGEAVFPGSILAEAGGMKVALVGIVGEDLARAGFQVLPAAPALKEELGSVKRQGAQLVVLLSSMGLLRTQDLVKEVHGVDFVVVSGTGRTTSSPVVEGETSLVEAGKRGKTLGILKLRPVDGASGWSYVGAADRSQAELDRANRRLRDLEKRASQARSEDERKSFERQMVFYQSLVTEATAKLNAAPTGGNQYTNRMENLARAVPDEPQVAALLAAAKERIQKGAGSEGAEAVEPDVELAFEGVTGPALLAARAQAGVATYGAFVGAQTCMGCHAQPYQQWSGTPHAHAWSTLVDEQRSMDFECFGCHVTGHGQEGGPVDPRKVGYLKAVQCESCHGAGAAHVADPKGAPLAAQVPEATCRGCHSVEQTGDRFDYKTYLPKVVHHQP